MKVKFLVLVVLVMFVFGSGLFASDIVPSDNGLSIAGGWVNYDEGGDLKLQVESIRPSNPSFQKPS